MPSAAFMIIAAYVVTLGGLGALVVAVLWNLATWARRARKNIGEDFS